MSAPRVDRRHHFTDEGWVAVVGMVLIPLVLAVAVLVAAYGALT